MAPLVSGGFHSVIAVVEQQRNQYAWLCVLTFDKPCHTIATIDCDR